MTTASSGIADRIVDYRHRISGDALLRYQLAAFQIDRRIEKSTDHVVDALLVALETGETTEVVRWARTQPAQTPLQIRELAHAACMAIGAEVARSFRGSFREVMGVLRRVEADLASTLRGVEPALEAIAA
jgi:hypothetical protein